MSGQPQYHPPPYAPAPVQPYPPVTSNFNQTVVQNAPPPPPTNNIHQTIIQSAPPPPPQNNTTVIMAQAQAPAVAQFRPGSCPRCGGYIDEHFSCCGIFCCIVFFPIGLICLFCMKNKKCDSCGKQF